MTEKKSTKNLFGKGFSLKTEVTNGECPMCKSPSVFVSLYKNYYRCMNCGEDTEQKVNGVISYIPVTGNRKNLPQLTFNSKDG